jgi:hypothetical protein
LEHSAYEGDLVLAEETHLCVNDVVHFLIYFIRVNLRLFLVKVGDLNV